MSPTSKKRSFSASFAPPLQPPATTRKSVDSMASSQNGGSNDGANAPNMQQGSANQGNATQPTTANAGQNQGTAATQAPTTTTTTAPAAPAPPPAPVLTVAPAPAAQASLRGTRWYEDEDWWVAERFCEEPRMPWVEMEPLFNAHFQTRPVRIGNQIVQRGQRSKDALRQRWRNARKPLQGRLDAQRGVGDDLGEESEGEGEHEDDQRLAQILLDVVESVKSRKEDSDDDDGPGGDDDLPGGGDAIAA
ncbi:hypothetical protein M409DRAFT_25853 [Zasmidium cellare ATCC 36951]|uniref:Uncharacterized protein n=1 Tax=Zasmidium cellare ATCC 36951 TaxID=1080233 RepID=A0A6A6C9G2_ZASCE|nr:uncharacterized protein M409DRAFT_25853 [Zasmidium cellare ATCC 36951]KAF2163665.1 hypothetical protein M409DRAFT_25853 [Zasmidium cellare ATCC 36951]